MTMMMKSLYIEIRVQYGEKLYTRGGNMSMGSTMEICGMRKVGAWDNFFMLWHFPFENICVYVIKTSVAKVSHNNHHRH